MAKIEKVLGWHFVRDTRQLGYDAANLTVEPGYVYSEPGPTIMCQHGMHASQRAIDALNYAPGPIICRVRLWGDIKHDTDKMVAQHREVLAMADASGELRLFACWCVRQVWHLLTDPRSRNAVEVAERYARGKATRQDLDAARDAAQAATRRPTRDAAQAAARAAAWVAAWDAAWAAAWAAARDATRVAVWDAMQATAWVAAWTVQHIEFERRMLALVGGK